MVIEKEADGIFYDQFPHLSVYPELWHGVFARHGGVSDAPFNSLNLTYGLGDPSSNVAENRARISRLVGDAPVIYAHQNHGDKILVFKGAEDGGMPIASNQRREGDALITDIPGRFIAVQVADCQAVLLYDANRRVVANIHSGWRGSKKNIIGRAVDAMGSHFGSRPKDLIAGIGPSLGPCCAEFINYEDEIPKQLWKYKGLSHLFDFWSMSGDQLQDAGVSAENIAVSGVCTKCRPDRFFSYRGEGLTGRFVTLIGIVP